MIIKYFVIIFICCSGIYAQTEQNRYIKVDYSPMGTYAIEYRYDYNHESHEVRLRPADNSGKDIVLYKFKRNAEVLFSPNETLIAINDYYGSDISKIVLFRKAASGQYQEIGDADIFESSWNYFKRLTKTNNLSLSHQYAECMQWSGDSRYMLVKLWGHENSDQYVDGWLCIYDVISKRYYSNLSIMNKSSLHLPKK